MEGIDDPVAMRGGLGMAEGRDAAPVAAGMARAEDGVVTFPKNLRGCEYNASLPRGSHLFRVFRLRHVGSATRPPELEPVSMTPVLPVVAGQ
jgi:hypothetical protein